ncbi:hypothetical protein L6452_18131 [Arctium lappa]|uniref:Uncharacterized protein n=1 Tax=Arctium lappa TaxID=4217 RepID=A0ACB9C5B6_ARCLA|nr:hypothetical protein L6452_18131 [Arctium lappa]
MLPFKANCIDWTVHAEVEHNWFASSCKVNIEYYRHTDVSGLFFVIYVPLKKENGQMILVPFFQSQENIAGKISLEPVQGKKVEHNGIKIELLGQIGEFMCTFAT